jgi:hypothetical protein
MSSEFRTCLGSIVAERGNRWIDCRMGVALLVSENAHPILVRKNESVSQDLALCLAEWSFGRWLKYDARWSELGAYRVRAVVLAKCQPDTRITYTRERTAADALTDTIHNDGSLTLLGEAGAHKDCWLLTSDRDADADLVYTWTHQEWDLTGDTPGAWTRSNGLWRYRRKFQPKAVPGTVAVSPVALPNVAVLI